MEGPAPEDRVLDDLIGATLPSEVAPGIVYRVVGRVGQGAMSVVFFALRVTSDGERPVVVKVMRPSFVRQAGPTALLIVKKESIALGRLNERVPATPFVVRFIDTGSRRVTVDGAELDLPWIVVEHVYGGGEGTTLTERVEHCVKTTGAAFDPNRAARAIDCLTNGLAAVHEVGVIHRDVKPDNVLCCGFGDGEILKIADFGVARPAGIATFHGLTVGTLGYVAPELLTNDSAAIGPWSDIFSLGAVLYFVLTGEPLFDVRTPGDALVAAANPKRKSVRDAKGLAAELRARELACRAIDYAIASATSAKIEARPQRAEALAQLLVPWLRIESRRESLIAKRIDALKVDDRAAPSSVETPRPSWNWTTIKSPLGGRVLRSVAWDGDGRCLAATSSGLSFWNGERWSDASLEGYPSPQGIRFVQRIGPGQWLIGGDDATFATYTTEGVSDVRRVKGDSVRFDRFSGDIDDIAVLVGSARDMPPTLHALVGKKRWLKPLALEGVAALAGLARIEDGRWMLVGRRLDGRGFCALYEPCEWEVEWLETPDVRAFIACAGSHDVDIGLAAGASGAIVWRQEGVVYHEAVDGDVDLSAAAVDAVGGGWTAAAGRIYVRRPAPGLIDTHSRTTMAASWELLWSDPSWHMPVVSLFAGLGVLIALTPDGGIIEGRLPKRVAPKK